MSATQTPVRNIGRYLLFGEIASGGMATVHFGRLSGPAGFSRTVAVKRLHPQFAKDPEFVTMFLDEARLAARIRHPNVVPTLDVVATEGEIFLVMEYVQGESLARLLRSLRAMTTTADARVIATVMSGVLHGLHAAHEARSEQGEALSIVHRDVSPQNILVGVDGTPRVLDFGVAKAVGRLQTTREGQIKGKLAYMAPEQLHNAPITRQSDIYAAAVVAWEALTGQRLFRGDNEAAVVTSVLQSPILPPSEVAPHVPLAFDRVLMRGLQRDPTRRYPTAREMAVDLERCVGIAAASEVSEWVEGLAHEELAKRATRIAAIESVSTPSLSSPALPPIGEMPTTLTNGLSSFNNNMQHDVRSDVSSIAVAPVLSSPPRRAKTKLGFLAAVAGGMAAGTVAILLIARGAQIASPAPAVSGAPMGAAFQVVPDDSASEPEPAASLALPEASTAPSVPLQPPVIHRHTPPPYTPPVITRKPPVVADCDPPFTIDDKGHKHYKPACLQ